MLLTIPVNLIDEICQFLNLDDAVRLIRTCKRLWNIRDQIHTDQVIALGQSCPFIAMNITIPSDYHLLKCDEEVLKEARKVGIQDGKYNARIARFLTNIRELRIRSSYIKCGSFPKLLERLEITHTDYVINFGDVKLPPSLKSLVIELTGSKTVTLRRLQNAKGAKAKLPHKDQSILILPDGLEELTIIHHREMVINKLPANLKRLHIDTNVKIIDKTIPTNLRSFSFLGICGYSEMLSCDYVNEINSFVRSLISLENMRKINLFYFEDTGSLDFSNRNIDDLSISYGFASLITLPKKLKSFYYLGFFVNLVVPNGFEVENYRLDGRRDVGNGYKNYDQVTQRLIPFKASSMIFNGVKMNEELILPQGLAEFTLKNSVMLSFPIFPEGIKRICLMYKDGNDNRFGEISFPSSLRALEVSSNLFNYCRKVTIPRDLDEFFINNCEVIQKD
jgi:hypothetical protein